ncbi:acyl carrier protein [Singulisphaera rosea]
MTHSTLLAEITEIVRRAGKVQPEVTILPESRLVEDLAIDSLDLVDVVLKIQDKFDIAIEDDDVPNLRTVTDLVSYVSAQRQSTAA